MRECVDILIGKSVPEEYLTLHGPSTHGLKLLPGKSDGPPLESCSLITTDANKLAAKVHDRMPVVKGHQSLLAGVCTPAVFTLLYTAALNRHF